MRKKWNLFWLVAVVMLMLGGCGSRREEKGYTVYYTDTTGSKLMDVPYNPAAETFDEMMKELLGQLANAPSGYISVFPSDVTVKGYERGIDALRIDFSKEYYELDNIGEILLRAAVIKTISQIPGVTKIMITVEGQQLVDTDGKPVPAMDAASFIDTKEGGINSYQYATLTCYFSDTAGEKLVAETREVHYSSNMMLERVVMEQLIRGPENAGASAVVSGSAKILSVSVNNGICTINLDSEFNKAPSESTVRPEVALYAVANSICGACETISGVKFEINGKDDVKYRDQVEIDHVFMPDMQFAKNEDSGTEDSVESSTEDIQTESVMQTEQASESDTELLSEDETSDMAAGNPVVGIDPLLTKE